MMRTPARRLVPGLRTGVAERARALGQLSINDRLERRSVDAAPQPIDAATASLAKPWPRVSPPPPPAAPDDAPPSRLAADFDAVGALGRGGFGRVIAARHRLDGATYALKLQHAAETRGEARAMAAIGAHGNVVSYVTAWFETGAAARRFAAAARADADDSESDDEDEPEDETVGVLQLGLCAGGDLRSWLDGSTRDASPAGLLAAAKTVGGDVAAALAHVHARGWAHLDVAPRNVFFDGRGTWRLGDFGLAARHDRAPAAASLDGAPERRLPPGVAPRDARPSDVWGLGVVLFELLRVFPTTMERALALEHLRGGRPCEGPLARLVDALVARDPDARPAAAACAAALRGA